MSIESFPLQWPPGWPRAKTRERSRFKTTFDAARKELYRELALMGAPNYCVILSTNLPLRRDGIPYASGKPVDGDPGVAVYFRRGLDSNQQLVFACDRWDRIEDNMRAIQHSIAAIRGIERWGASDMLERAFTGFTALPAPESPKHWTEVLDVSKTDSIQWVESMYREKMKTLHPDAGGDHDKAANLNRAIKEFRTEKLKGM